MNCPGPHLCLHMWTVYEGASDFPGSLVARMYHCTAGQIWPDAKQVRVAPSLEILRQALPPGLFRMHRLPHDEPHVLETWL